MDEPVRDKQTVLRDGTRLDRLPDGMSLREAMTQVDHRGTLCEVFDPRWGWRPEPLVYLYTFTLRPGITRGWVLHKIQEDRLFLLSGEIQMTVYDERPESPTYGHVSRVFLSDYKRTLVNIPPGIWHALTNIGQRDAFLLNMPTHPYNHEQPDKYRLPLNTDRIPYSFQ